MTQKTQLMDFWKEQLHLRDIELKAFDSVKREDFVPENMKDKAYEDAPLPILRGKTISQPTTVMLMTAALELQPGDTVFEVGSGSGYQTAIIARIVGDNGCVVSTEVIPELVHFAKDNLRKAGIENALVLEEDGSKGHEEKAPYDKMIITAACKEFPPKLIEQLKVGGMIVAPVGSAQEQEMVRGTKTKDGKLELEFLGPFLFSPLYGKLGFEG